MITGFTRALSEITLVLFTTLAPSGVFAFMVMCAVLIGGKLDDTLRRRINQFLCIPLVISMVGLVASATHLGNPANALYVFMGVGRSPLSTEVFCAVLFLLLAATYWLYSFARTPRLRLQKIWAGLVVLCGTIFITAIAFAYHAETIVSWHTWYTPLGIWLNALVGGPLLALLSLQVAQAEPVIKRAGKALCFISAGALGANTLVLGLQGAALPTLQNSFGTAADLVPFYGVLVVAFFLCCLAGILLFWLPLRKKQLPKLSHALIACTLVLVGIFLVRFAFYLMHMTVGLGV